MAAASNNVSRPDEANHSPNAKAISLLIVLYVRTSVKWRAPVCRLGEIVPEVVQFVPSEDEGEELGNREED